MYENRQYNKPAKVEYEGILEKHRNKSPTADKKFFEWCVQNSEKYNSYHKMGEALGLKGKTFEKLCNKNGVFLIFDPKAKNTPKPYQDKEWLYQQKIVFNKTNEEIANEFGWTKRVVEKWVQIFGFGNRDYKNEKKLSEKQISLIKGSILGDGHIAQNNSFIVSHAENQKDYLFWKYKILEDACSSSPSYYEKKKKYFSNGNTYDCLPYYRFNTRLLSCLVPIKDTPRIEIIKNLDELGVSVWFLDDASREMCNWRLCVAALSEEEKEATIEKLNDFGVSSHLCKDTRYLFINAESSRKIDEVILRNIPNDLDVIQYKILNKRR